MTATVTSPSTFVIFFIAGGCGCCAEGLRETTLPAGWRERSGMTLRGLLAFPHDVPRHAVRVLVNELADGLTRERIAELREAAKTL